MDPSVTLVDPTCVHVEPFAETYAVSDEPARTSFNQVGGVWVAEPTKNVEAPAVALARNSIPPPGRRSTTAFAALALSDSRIITPALA